MAQTLDLADPRASEASRPGLSTAMRWSLLFLVSIGVLIAFLDRTSISTALADKGFNNYFAVADTDRGWINAAFFWTYSVFQMPLGWVVDRYGVKWPYTICFAVWCIAHAATGFVTTIIGLILIRLIVGVAEAVVMPASYRWIRNNFNEDQGGTAVGIFAMGNKFGPAIGAPIASWLIINQDWRMMFFLTGAVGLLWLVPWVLFVKNDHPKLAEAAAAKRQAASVPFASIMSSPVVWGAMIVNFCYGYFTFYCMTWMPAYLVEQRHLSLEKSGLYTFFSFAGIAIVAVAAGWAADRLIARGGNPVFVRKAFIITGFIGACTVVLGTRAQSLDMALFWNVFSLSFLGLATANNLALCRLTLIPRPAVGLVTGVQQVATGLAGGVTASLSGWLLAISGGYDLPIDVIFVFLLVGAASTWIFLRPEWSPKIVAEGAAA